MAGGIARDFRARWPDMAAAYRQRCIDGQLQLGDVMPWCTPNVVIYNLATQLESGPDARLDAIDISLRAALLDAEARDLARLGVPRIGAGIGGLRWSDVSEVLERAGDDTPVELVVVTRSRST